MRPGGCWAEAPAGGNLVDYSFAKTPAEGNLVVRTQQPCPDCGGSVQSFGLFRKKNVGQ